jgi:hypothetical protein
MKTLRSPVLAKETVKPTPCKIGRILFLVLCGLQMLYIGMHLTDDVFNISSTAEKEMEMEFSGSGAGGDHNNICPSAVKLFDQSSSSSSSNSIEIMIEKAKDFHQRGGNLVSIENYLNGQMQNTLDKQDLKFEFNKNINQQPLSTNRAIHDLNLYYQTHDVPRGGYGQPLPGKWTGVNAGAKGPLFGNRWINVIESDTADRFKVAIGHVGPNCTKEIHFAEQSYEEKIFCVPPEPVGNGTAALLSEECNIFSIGSNDQWGFEEEVVQKLPNCVTHTFDCTLQNNKPRQKPNSDNVQFYPYCIGDGEGDSNNNNNTDDKTKRFLPYKELWERTNTTRPPKLLKIDVEGFEFGVIPSMLRNLPQEIWAEQIMMEVHWGTRMVDVPSMLRTRQASEISLMFGQLFNYGGYLPVKAKYFEPGCGTCLEVLLVRVLCYD